MIVWALRIIQMLESMDKEDVDYEVMNEKLGWTMKQKKDIEYFFELFELAAVAKELTRKLHIDKKVWKYCEGLLKEMSSSSKGKKFAYELVAFLREQGEKVDEEAWLLGCSEIIESGMSKLKLLDRECGNSGYTRSILGLAACFGPIDRVCLLVLHILSSNLRYLIPDSIISLHPSNHASSSTFSPCSLKNAR